MGKRSSRWGYIRTLAWNRDKQNKAVCHICGQPIDYTLVPSSCESAWEPDHIQAFIDHPELELDLNNIAASHRRCNRARGKSGIVDIGPRSRIW